MDNKKFMCPICGTEYDNAVEMAECIIECNKLKKEEEAKARAEKLRAEFEKRITEIKNEAKKLYELKCKFRDDYKIEIHISEDGDRVNISSLNPVRTLIGIPRDLYM